ncbi:MAG: Circadian clock protein KaiB [Sphingobacteriales bacterium]|nr:Circadian clock protein KaiB [Sphingobacteriales bacterium]
MPLDLKDRTTTPTWQLPEGQSGVITLTLYVAGASPNSVRAISNITSFCEGHLKEQYSLEIIDVHQQPLLAQSEQIIALPMLIKQSPAPKRRLIGDMSDTEKIIRGLGLIQI